MAWRGTREVYAVGEGVLSRSCLLVPGVYLYLCRTRENDCALSSVKAHLNWEWE